MYVRNNHGTSSSTITIDYYNASGTYNSSQSYTLSANGSTTATPPNNFTGSAKVVGIKDTSVSVLVEHITTPYSSGAYEGVEYPGIKSLVPLVHRNNSGWNNEIFLQNTSASGTASVTVSFLAQTGTSQTYAYTLAPQETKLLNTSSSSFSGLGSLFVGSAEVTSDLPVALVYNQYKTNFSSMIQASNAPYMGSDVYAPLVQNSNNNYASGFSAQNLTNAGSLAVTYYNGSGSSCANSNHTGPWPLVVLPIPPAGNSCPSVASAKFDGDDGRLMYTQINQLKTGTDQASGYAALAHPTKLAIAPRIYHNANNYVTGIQVQNTGSDSTAVTVSYYNDSGVLQNSQTTSISSNASYTFFPNVSPFIGSARILATQPIAATVNFLKSGNGDVLASYTAINRPDGNVTYSTRQGFDMCEAPSISELQTWMNYSPYRFIGIYIGGITRSPSCPQANLNSNWITQTANQGWDFVPIWAGLQPPCADPVQFPEVYRFSPVAGTAYNSGVSEATSAANTVASLGRTNSIIYYNFEPYTENTTCNTAVRSFISGWVTTLHAQGFKAGVYGNPSNLDDLQNASNTPDAIWAAAWNYSVYNTAASAYGLGSYIPDSLWSGQRIRQYAGDHTTETWGGLNFSPDPIDSNVADGPITDAPTTNILVTRLGAKVQDMDLLTENEGWVLTGQQVFWTGDGGTQWTNITPTDASLAYINAVFFKDTLNGWIMGQSEEQFVFYYTTDGGKSWQSLPFDGLSLDDDTRQSRVYLSFMDTATGWMVFKLPSSSNFSRGLLFRTEDGGKSWRLLNIPLGEPMHFANAQNGWLAGGPAGTQLFKTEDGGNTWLPITIPVEKAENTRLLYGSPILAEDGRVLVPILIEGEYQKEARIYATQDGGASWVLVGNISPASGSVLDKLTSTTMAWLQNEDTSGLFLHYDGVRQLDFVTLETGLAYASHGLCIETECSIESHLLITHDGGQTWTEVELP